MYVHGLRAQMDEREQRAAKERQEQYLTIKNMEKLERDHQRRLAEQAGQVRLYRPLQHSQWYS